MILTEFNYEEKIKLCKNKKRTEDYFSDSSTSQDFVDLKDIVGGRIVHHSMLPNSVYDSNIDPLETELADVDIELLKENVKNNKLKGGSSNVENIKVDNSLANSELENEKGEKDIERVSNEQANS